MIALGWCLADQSVPEPLSLSVCGQLAVMCASSQAAPSPRDRLDLLQRAYDAGIDLVPLATSRDWPVDLARDLAMQAATDLREQLTRLSGLGQMTLQLSLADTNPDRPADTDPTDHGRSWLRQRADRLAAKEAMAKVSANFLLALARQIDVPASAIQPTRYGAAIHFLMPRNSLPDLGRRLAQSRLQHDPPVGAVFSLSGPWPAFDFVHPPQMVSA